MIRRSIPLVLLVVISAVPSVSLSAGKIWRYVNINNGVRIELGDDIYKFSQLIEERGKGKCLKGSVFSGCDEICFVLDDANLILGMVFKQYPGKTFSGLLDEYSKLLGSPLEIIPEKQAVWRDESTEMTLTNSNDAITIAVHNAS